MENGIDNLKLETGDENMSKSGNILRRNKTIYYLCKSLKHINDKKYIEEFLGQEGDPLLWKFHTYGNKNFTKIIYIVTENGNGWGFFAEFRAMLTKLKFANRYGMIPYMRWGKGFLYYEPEPVNGTLNAYEYFFDQPSIKSIGEVNESRMVMESKPSQAHMIEVEYKNELYDMSREYLDDMADMYAKYVHLNKDMDIKIENEIKNLFGEKKTLGVHFRGTDFHMGYKNHPIAVSIEQEIKYAKQALENGFEQIFLATDEMEAINKFKVELGDKVVFFDDVYRGNSEVSVAFSQDSRNLHRYRLGYEVLRDMYTLSRCSGLIAGLSQVVNCARIVKKSKNENYEYLNIINNGISSKAKSFSQRDTK